MTQWEQIAIREGWRKQTELPTVRFTRQVSDPITALGILVFEGKPIYTLEAGKLTKISYRPPHFIVTVWEEGNPIVSSISTPDFSQIAHLFRPDSTFYLSD